MNTTRPLPPISEMERAYLGRDSAYNGVFFLGVRTTGIFCRPTCPARKPLPKNVEYFATPREALVGGYRPCKRCRPMALNDQPEWARRLIEDVEQNPSAKIQDSDLAARGVDPATVRRYFQGHYGMTFQAYSRARRLISAFHGIQNGKSLDAAVFESGYESHSGFRDAFVKAFGDTPSKARGRDCLITSRIQSPLGPLVAAAAEDGVCLLEFTDRRMLETQLEVLRKHFGVPLVAGTNEHLRQLEQELEAYFLGTLQEFRVPLVFPGTPFQQRVWNELLRIPYGETRSYEELATTVELPGGQRPVGRANGQNRIAIVIPCHRVIRKDGHLGGYGGGLRRKQFLLDLERRSSGKGTKRLFD